MVRLIASDIDGTLLMDGSAPLDPRVFGMIRALRARGIRFAAASGRQYTNLRRLFAPVADEIDYICENGNLVVCGGEICYKRTVERSFGTRLIRAMQQIEGCEVLLSGVYCCYVQPKDPSYVDHMRYFVKNDVEVVDDLTTVPEEYLKLSAYFRDGIPETAQKQLRELAAPLLRPVVSGLAWLDFLLDGCNKGTAMRALQHQLGVTKAETMSFGDNENDIELLEQSGIACAMRSGNPRLHRLADHLVDDVVAFVQCNDLWEMPAGQ